MLVGHVEAAERGVIALQPLQRPFHEREIGPAGDGDRAGSIDRRVERKPRAVLQAANDLLTQSVELGAQLGQFHRLVGHSSSFSMAMKASWGISTLPNIFMRFLPSFCFSSSLRLRVTSPP